jgi:hypothetical protein
MSHPVWSEKELLSIAKTHIEPTSLTDRIALSAVKFARWSFDTLTFYKWGPVTEQKVLNRAIFLETVAGVPGMVRALGASAARSITAYLSFFSTDSGHASPLAIPSTDGPRPWLDSHSARGGGERAYAPAHIPEAEKAQPHLPNVGRRCPGDAQLFTLGFLFANHDAHRSPRASS